MQGFHLSREIIIMIYDFRDVEMFDFLYDSFFLNRALDLFDGPKVHVNGWTTDGRLVT